MEQAVRDAFIARPRLVDSAPGFLGMETFTDSGDGTVFYLVTRWSDVASFKAWHHSSDHRLSLKLIPRGLKLDPSYTKVVILNRLEGGAAGSGLEESAADAAPFLAKYLSSSQSLHYIAASSDGRILACSRAAAEGLKAPAEDVVGSPLWGWLPGADAEALRARVGGAGRYQESFLLNFSDSENHPYTLECRLDVRPDGFVLVGEVPLGQEQALRDGLIELNNRLAVLTRENARQNKALKRAKDDLELAHAELAKTHEELKNSHWHLKKIREVLPICMCCGKVKTGESDWDELVNYFKEHSNFLSHSYCPDCYARTLERYGRKD